MVPTSWDDALWLAAEVTGRVIEEQGEDRPTSSASSRRWVDLLPCHRQSAEAGNSLDRAVRPDPVGHDDSEQQQTDRDRER